jgi:Flp pilus assembly secretin CpaC
MIRHVGILSLIVLLTACSADDVPLAKATTGRDPTVAEVPNSNETVRGDNDPPIVTLDLANSLHEHRLTVTDDLPGNIIIPTTNLNAVPITAALQAVLSGTDVSLSWNTGTLGSRLVTVMNLSGPLPKVVDKICSAAKVFCDYRHGSLELSEKETFVVSLPPMVHSITSSVASTSTSGTSGSSGGGISSASISNSGTNSMVDAIDSLLGEKSKAQVDEQGGNILYTASVDGEDRVSQYLQQLRTGRPLVVLQMYIWEVTLTRENSEGINWTQFQNNTIKSLSLSGTNNLTSAATTAGSVSLGAVTSGIISANAVASFLATKGRVQTISNPQVTFVSGTNAQLKVGGTINYISQVGTLTNSTNVSGTSTSSNAATNASTNTVSTSSIDTGLTITVAGSYENGVVFANLDLTLRNLVSLNPTNSGGGTIDLPQTTDEDINTALRVRPGDSLVLAGLVTSSDTQSGQGLPIGEDNSLPFYGDAQRNNHELVMIVKPSIVLFAEKSPIEEAKKKDTSKPLPDALVIDKDGSRVLTLPQPQPIAMAPPAELMVNDTRASSMQNISVAPSDDGAPVDKQLMQRGFSHAFDQLLQPAGSTQ